MVAPVMREGPINMIARLNPAIVLEDKACRIRMQEMAALPRNQLGPVIENVSDRHTEFVAAIDLLFTGV
jgi:hypothetical protein